VNEIYGHAVKLLRRRDYTVRQMRQKLEEKFGEAPDAVINQLLQKRFLDDRRFAENVVQKHKDAHPSRVLTDLIEAGIPEELAQAAVAARDWPSLREALKAKMDVLRLRPPLEPREAARLFRALSRLGYEEEEIREELQQLHDQQ
jgi:SOS response regulatory protein OraA/RecX